MSKTEQISHEQTKDNFVAFQQSSNKYFADVENSVQRYQQATSDLQDEYIKAWKNVVNANISLQKEFANKTGFNSNLPEATQNVIENITENVIKTRSVRDQIAVATIEATKKNIKAWNDNANTFADLNRNIMQSWLSACTPKREN